MAMVPQPLPVIFDCDPGHDDAIALLLALASPELHLLGVITSYGNQTLVKTTVNALRLLQFAGRKQQRLTGALHGLLICYLTLATLISQTSGMDTRMRTSITFALAILAAVGIAWSWDSFSKSLLSSRMLANRTFFGKPDHK